MLGVPVLASRLNGIASIGMPFHHVVDHQRRYIETVVTGRVTWDEVEAHWAAELADGAESYTELMDASGAVVELSAREIRGIVALLESAARKGPIGACAVVVPSDVGFGMIRMLGILVESFTQVHAFRDRPAAMVWLAPFITAEATPPYPSIEAEIRKV
jgi:hypothetical protein